MASKAKLFFKFLFSGALAAGLNFGSRFLYSLVMPFELAVVFAYVSGMVLAFWLFSTRVFKNHGRSFAKASFRFTVVNIFGLLQTWLVAVGLVTFVFTSGSLLDEAISHLIGMSLATISSYFGHRFYTFKA